MSRFPVINAGTTPAIGVLNQMIPQRAVKSASTSRTSTTTLTADPDLTVPVDANAAYDVEISLPYNGAATGTGDIKFSFSVPSGASITGGFEGIANPLGVAILTVATGSTLFSASNGTGNPLWCKISCTLFTSGTSGNLVLNWAQNTSSGTATTLLAGAKMSAARVK